MIGFYDPTFDEFLDQNNNLTTEFYLPNLSSLAISKTKNNDQWPFNTNLLKSDIILLLAGGQVKHLEFNGLGELDNDFFIKLFSLPAVNTFESDDKLVHHMIQSIELKNINKITAELIHNYLLQPNRISFINLDTCKLLSKRDYAQFVQSIYSNHLNCVIKWT